MRASRERQEEPLRVLFVCTANISRSPYAEFRARHLAGADGVSRLQVASAGVPGWADRGIDPAMAAELTARGADPSGHLSRALSGEILDETHVVVTLEFVHRLRITELWPQHVTKIFGLHQLADALGRAPSGTGGLAALDRALGVALPDSLTWDVADPYRRGASAARACADEIDEALAVIVPGLAGIPAGQDGGRHRPEGSPRLGVQAPRW